MAQEMGTRILLSRRYNRVALPVDPFFAHCILDGAVESIQIAPLEQVGDMNVLGFHPLGDQRVQLRVGPMDMQVPVGSVPALCGQISPSSQLQLFLGDFPGLNSNLAPLHSVFDSLDRLQFIDTGGSCSRAVPLV